MVIPFSTEQFLEVFKTYNLGIWPMQIIAYAIGLAAIIFAIRRTVFSDRLVSGLLAFLWIWTGIAYHIVFFSTINRIAYIFGGLFIVQGILFLIFGVFLPKVWYRFRLNFPSIVGVVFLLFAMVVYPVIGSLVGHGYPNSPWFGLTPCPLTIFTFGLLLWTDKKVPFYMYIIPFLWSLIGVLAAIKLGIFEDVGLLVAGVAGTIILLIRDRRRRKKAVDEQKFLM
ncbi:hypothetical protein GF359_04315 [candidate division WOR-3 bacterium]|uniref:Uncharacterized protein n=1 Tax=candidate division WOR-3 bacterium TaxID=2052148 RepID=A0A9D5QCU7_UNCW3|nr:hypothetical protein [candidate division WOR-3 bacterium]MBD3364422.1 hypothetical protein [candidate division WOR-3 bacterium]